ncbi:MAG TPA: transcription antitermination factor NusB [bacterium]|nr:transcription antitermination factor NusB [bacterium]HPO11195.1 transcription antitermination factor NusB [bacterium]
MSNRHLIRSIVLQSLFEWDFKDKKDNIDKFIDYDIKEFAPTLEKDDFLQFLTKGVTRNIKDIDKIIKTYAPEWPINQISPIDRNILRIAIFELIYNDSTPYKVVINEAIELAKNFGSNNSSKFINGVLGTVFENLNKNITNVYEIDLIIKDSNKYLVNKQNNSKISFIKFENIEKKKENENIKQEIIEEEKIEKTDLIIDKNDKIEEQKIIEYNEDRLDNTDFMDDKEKQEKDIIDLENKKKEEIYIEFAKQKITELIGNINYNIKVAGEINYTIRKNNNTLFPLITKKNILFLGVVNIDNIEKIKEDIGIWVDEKELENNIEYKNLKILKNL